ncbi:Lrp/AsnC family transcriptional regulator [Bacilliculturomica massiliensis]|uniref:Lrp/AsnC family transcriptional regulator n=1 Tax=Bacilliculturomica massiliensis TaxID=1917867 RepID=UPI00102FC8AD|nr:Lrp/AsnC family transcriptional regulator [Bacilliculturomica massiliensis]
MYHTDDIDKKILALLSRNSRISLNQLSQQVFLTSPAVAARIEKLEKSGVITGYRADIDAEKLGYPITAFIELTMDPDQKNAFVDFIRDSRNVLECYHVAGAYSMLLKVCFPTPSLLDQFVGSLQSFGKTQTQIVFSTVVSPRSVHID